jgi:hypothetical protein
MLPLYLGVTKADDVRVLWSGIVANVAGITKLVPIVAWTGAVSTWMITSRAPKLEKNLRCYEVCNSSALLTDYLASARDWMIDESQYQTAIRLLQINMDASMYVSRSIEDDD